MAHCGGRSVYLRAHTLFSERHIFQCLISRVGYVPRTISAIQKHLNTSTYVPTPLYVLMLILFFRDTYIRVAYVV